MPKAYEVELFREGKAAVLAQPSDNIGRGYDEHGHAVYAYVCGMVGPTRAETITRDAFVELFRSERPTASGHSVRTALLTICDRYITTALSGSQAEASAPSDRVESALASLNHDDRRAVLFLVHGDGQFQTAAEALQLSAHVMATRVQSGLRYLGLQLNAHG
jgi:DNA-directed RNA polymerase specialized sigma24 family protein